MMKLISYVCLIVLLPVVASGQLISTIAGTGVVGNNGDGGPAISAQLSVFSVIAADKYGNVFIADVGNQRVRKINLSTGIISTYAGTGVSGFSGDGGPATLAQFNGPTYVAVNTIGDLFITDGLNHRIRKVDKTTGIISTVAGNGTGAFSGDGGMATAASIYGPQGIAIDNANNLIIVDNGNHRVRKVDVNGIITTIGGTGNMGSSGDGGLALSADISGVVGMCTDDSNNIYLACISDARIRKINTMGIITTVAGNGNVGFSGDGGLATAAQLNWPYSVRFDNSGNMYIADQVNNRIRKVNSLGIISTIAGDGDTGFDGDGGTPDTATFNRPASVAFDTCGNMYIADKMNKRLRKITFDDSCGILSTKSISTITSSFSLHPNPTTSTITITSNTKIKQVTITDITGREVLRSAETTIDVSRLVSGVYFVRVWDVSGGSRTEKIIKQ